MGKSGSAVAYFLSSESSYVDFQRLRKIPLLPMDGQADATWGGQPMPAAGDALAATLQKISESDRDPLEKGLRAFLTYVRGYKEHQLKYIFRLGDLDLGATARLFGLLKLPVMPEIRKGGKSDSFVTSLVDPDTVAFK